MKDKLRWFVVAHDYASPPIECEDEAHALVVLHMAPEPYTYLNGVDVEMRRFNRWTMRYKSGRIDPVMDSFTALDHAYLLHVGLLK
jgi:hypothetical protein